MIAGSKRLLRNGSTVPLKKVSTSATENIQKITYQDADYGRVRKSHYYLPNTRRRVNLVDSSMSATNHPLENGSLGSSCHQTTLFRKRRIGQPQKWRLIHDLSDHTLGHRWSINAGIEKAKFPVTYLSIITATHEVFCRGNSGCMLWGSDP